MKKINITEIYDEYQHLFDDFEVGDKVKVIACGTYDEEHVFKVGRIIEIRPEQYEVRVRFSDKKDDWCIALQISKFAEG